MTKWCSARSRWWWRHYRDLSCPEDVLLSVGERWRYLRDLSWPADVLLSLRGWWRRLRGSSWSDDILRSPRDRWYLLRGQSWPNVVLLNLRGRCRHLREVSWPDDVVHVVSTWTWTFFPRSIRIRPCFAQSTWTMRSSPRPIMTNRCSAQSAWTMTSSPRSVMTRRCSAQSTYRWWRRLWDMSWPGDVLCVVHVDYGVVPQVYHEQTMFFVVYVNYFATSSPRSIMNERCFAWFTWTTSSSARSMTRRCSLRRGWCGLCPYRRC